MCRVSVRLYVITNLLGNNLLAVCILVGTNIGNIG